MRLTLATLFWALLVTFASTIFGFPRREPCNVPYNTDNSIMGNTPVLNAGLNIAFVLNNSPIACGSTNNFTVGVDKLTVSNNFGTVFTGAAPNWALDVKGGVFKTPNLANRCTDRMYRDRDNTASPSPVNFVDADTEITVQSQSLSVFGAGANVEGRVDFSSTCTINLNVQALVTPSPVVGGGGATPSPVVGGATPSPVPSGDDDDDNNNNNNVVGGGKVGNVELASLMAGIAVGVGIALVAFGVVTKGVSVKELVLGRSVEDIMNQRRKRPSNILHYQEQNNNI